MNTKIGSRKHLHFSNIATHLIRFASVTMLLASSLFVNETIAHADSSGCSARSQYVDLSGCDLTGMDFSALDLTGVDFSNANLAGANFSKAKLNSADFSGADLSGVNAATADLSDAILIGSDLSKAQLVGAKLVNAIVIGSDLRRANFKSADLSGADLTDTNAVAAIFTRANFNQASMQGANAMSAVFAGLDLSSAQSLPKNFAGANLTGANFRGMNLSDINFRYAKISGTDFSNAVANRADFRNVKGQQSVFKGTELISAKLQYASLQNTNFDGADLAGADFSKSYLNEANFSYSHFRSPSPSPWTDPETTLYRTNFQDTILSFANFESTYIDRSNFSRANIMYGNFHKTRFAPTLLWLPVGVDQSGSASSKFVDAILNGANFSESYLEWVSFERASLIGANFSKAYLDICDVQWGGSSGGVDHNGFKNANLTSVNLSNATIAQADFTSTNLSYSNLTSAKANPTVGPWWGGEDTPISITWKGTNFAHANFTNADFSPYLMEPNYPPDVLLPNEFIDVNLSDAILTGANFSGIKWTNVTCVDGSNSNAQSPPKCPTEPFQALAMVKPTVTGSAKVSTSAKPNLLKVNAGSWIGLPAPYFNYQWYKCSVATSVQAQSVSGKCSRISGATTATLTVSSALKNYYVLAQVTGTSAGTPATTWYTASTIQIK